MNAGKAACVLRGACATFSIACMCAAPGVGAASDFLAAKGYVSYLQTVWDRHPDSPWLIEGTLLNRLDLSWYPARWLTLTGAARTRLVYGDLVEQVPGYASLLTVSTGYLDLSHVWADGDSWLIHTEIDRLFAELALGQWQVRAGRNRINWGLALSWNPNDLFNTYSLFDIDYPERPGTDAVQVEFCPSATSDAQLVWRMEDDTDSMVVAALYRINRWGYDMQLIGGLYRTDIAAGGGWSGQIGGAGLRGELTYFYPRRNGHVRDGVLSGCAGADYTFAAGLYVHGSVLYQSDGAAAWEVEGEDQLSSLQFSAKRLSPSRFSVLGQVSKRITPLVSADLSAMFNPVDLSTFVWPVVTFSVTDNAEVMLTAQVFAGRKHTEFGGYGVVGAGRFRWNF
jgi:hypothetical protein